MQIIRGVEEGADQYVSASLHFSIKPPSECPHCGAVASLKPLGYYNRNVTSPKSGVLRISVRRFRCCKCGRTVSILPGFAQPYRLVLNATINEYFGGTLHAPALTWLSLLKQYWKRFSEWLPDIERTLRVLANRSPPHSDATGWWQVLSETMVSVDKVTSRLVGEYRVTLFGRYRCHSPWVNGVQVHSGAPHN
jgi:transposase